MKLNKIITLLIVVAASSLTFLSCTREAPLTASAETGIGDKATVQAFGATVKAARNYVYVDGIQISGGVFALGGVFPATAYASKIDAGARQFLIKDTAAVTTQVPLSFSEILESGKSYTIFTYDTTTSIKQKTVLNNIIIPADTTCMLRFANFIYNTTALPNVDVYSLKRGNTIVFNNVSTTGVTNYIPYAAGQTDVLTVYATGTTTPVLATITVPSLVQTRSYTAAYTGSYQGTKVTSVFVNY